MSRRAFGLLFALALAIFLCSFSTLLLFHHHVQSKEQRLHPLDDFAKKQLHPTTPSNNDYPTSLKELQDHIPHWVYEYMTWHAEQRRLFPDTDLLTNRNAPKILLKYCSRNCGGLHDRLGTIHHLLWTAYTTRRVLLIHWFTPHPLELFLQPNLVNWTVPYYEPLQTRDGLKRATSDFLDGWNQHQLKTNYRNPLQHAANVHNNIHILSLMYWGSPALNLTHELELQGLDNALDQVPATATTTSTGVTASSFGHVWHAMFRPSDKVQAMLKETTSSLGLHARNYAATHCRVRHPGRYPVDHNPEGKIPGTSADVSGLPFVGANRHVAVTTALHALECTQWLLDQQHQAPNKQLVYFLSDSDDLVAYLVDEMVGHNNTTTSADRSLTTTAQPDHTLDEYVKSWKHTHDLRIVSRDVMHTPATHLDREKKVPKRTHLATFVDLYLALRATCVSFGVGNFGYLATKISGTSCLVRHEDFSVPSENSQNWFNQQTGGAPLCPIPMKI